MPSGREHAEARDSNKESPGLDEQEARHYLNQLYIALDAYPVEDGINHTAELIIASLLSYNNTYVLEWLKEICLDTLNPSLASSIVRCLGRQVNPGTASWRTELVRDGLKVNNLEIRDSTVQAAELWEEPTVLDVLRDHDEPVPWLRDYIQEILKF